jgi:hypothetical protein
MRDDGSRMLVELHPKLSLLILKHLSPQRMSGIYFAELLSVIAASKFRR